MNTHFCNKCGTEYELPPGSTANCGECMGARVEIVPLLPILQKELPAQIQAIEARKDELPIHGSKEENEELQPEDREAAQDLYARLLKGHAVLKAAAKPAKDREHVFRVLREDGVGQTWKNAVFAKDQEQAIRIVKAADDMQGAHKNYRAEQLTGKKGEA